MRLTRSSVAVAALALLALPGGTQASSLDGAPPLGGAAPPSASKIKPCGSFVTGKAGVVTTHTKAKGTICGSQVADRITSKGGAAYIETFGGVDYVDARNGKPDEIWNGSGIDGGLFDSCDRVYDLENGKKSTSKCPGVSPPKSGYTFDASAERYPVQLPAIDCDANGGARRFRISRMPLMRAVNATADVDFQSVAWSALLFERVAAGWKLRVQTEWLWDRAYDEQVAAFPGNTWRTFVKNTRRDFAELRRTEPGTYRVVLHFKWYGGEGVPDREWRVWAGKLFRALRRRARAC